MAFGLTASYGTFAVMAGRFLYPTDHGTAWMFVVETNAVSPGGSFSYRSPAGVPVVITRSADSSPNVEPPASDFLALSSTCPHLGCRVHWEAHNERFFCPCHNGAFDPKGTPIAGPPLADNQRLPEYPLKVENGLLFIEMQFESLIKPESGVAHAARNRLATDGLADTRTNRITNSIKDV
jgi:Rieske Fe-S protein